MEQIKNDPAWILKCPPCFVRAAHELVRAVDVMTAQEKRIYIFMINESKKF